MADLSEANLREAFLGDADLSGANLSGATLVGTFFGGAKLVGADLSKADLSGVAVTADGQRAVSASSDRTLKVWDLEAGLPLVRFHCDANLRCCAFAGERKIIAGDAGGRLHFLLLEERTRM